MDNQRINTILEDLPEELPEGEKANIITCTVYHIIFKQKCLFTFATDGKSVLAIYLLYYLLPDTRAMPDHRRILTIIKVNTAITPCTLAKHYLKLDHALNPTQLYRNIIVSI